MTCHGDNRFLIDGGQPPFERTEAHPCIDQQISIATAHEITLFREQYLDPVIQANLWFVRDVPAAKPISSHDILGIISCRS